MSNVVSFIHRNIDLGSGTKQEKIDRYVQMMGGTPSLMNYILMNLKISNDDSTEITVVEE